MGDVAFAFVPAAWGFTKQPALEVMSFSQRGPLTLLGSLDPYRQPPQLRPVEGEQVRVQLSIPSVHLPFTVFWRSSFLVLVRVILCISALLNAI